MDEVEEVPAKFDVLLRAVSRLGREVGRGSVILDLGKMITLRTFR